MEHLAGASLESLHKFPRFSSFEAKIGIVVRILEALHYAHGRGVVHRDIKPANVQILPDSSVKLLDFGIAHLVGAEALTAAGAVTATAHYASPEQLRGEESGAATDVYSTGILAYEMLTRRRPFVGNSVAIVLSKVLHDPLPPMDTSWSEAFPAIEQIIQRATAKRSADRYASAEDMKNALAAFLAASRDAIVAKQAEVSATTARVVIEAKSLIASGRTAAAAALLKTALRNDPDAEEARTLLTAAAEPPRGAGPEAEEARTLPWPASDASGTAAATAAPEEPDDTLLLGTRAAVPPPPASFERGSVAADTAARPERPRWPASRILIAAVPALVVVLAVVLRGPSWLPWTSPETPGGEPASELAAGPLPEPAGSLPAAGVDRAAGRPPAAAPAGAPATEAAAESDGRSVEPPAATAGAAAETAAGGSAPAATAPPAGTAPVAVAADSTPVAATAAAVAEPPPAASPDAETPVPALSVSGAKDLYYAATTRSAGAAPPAGVAPSGQTAAGGETPRPGIRYRILWRGLDGNPVEVDADTMFQSGDRIRFAFEPNVDGFLYVIQRGSSGRWSVLLPHPQINAGRNAVTQFDEVVIPPEGWFRFDGNPGAEQVFVYLSREPVDTLPGAVGPVVSPQSVEQPTVIELANSVRSRDLVFEKEDTPGGVEQAAYVVNQDDDGGVVAWTVELRHR